VDLQHRSVATGYDQVQEDALLAAIDWPHNGYRLFDIAVLAGSCLEGWFQPIAESNAVFVRRDAYERLGGFDERFDLPGGGFVNLDFFRRAALREGSELVILLGGGGRLSTNSTAALQPTSATKVNDKASSTDGRPNTKHYGARSSMYLGSARSIWAG